MKNYKRVWKSRGRWNWALYRGNAKNKYKIAKGIADSKEKAIDVMNIRSYECLEKDRQDRKTNGKAVNIYTIIVGDVTNTYIGKEIVNATELCNLNIQMSHELTNEM